MRSSYHQHKCTSRIIFYNSGVILSSIGWLHLSIRLLITVIYVLLLHHFHLLVPISSHIQWLGKNLLCWLNQKSWKSCVFQLFNVSSIFSSFPTDTSLPIHVAFSATTPQSMLALFNIYEFELHYSLHRSFPTLSTTRWRVKSHVSSIQMMIACRYLS